MPTLRNKIGLVIAVLLAIGDIVSAFRPTPDGEEGPPYAILLVSAFLGVITLAAVVPAWRGNRSAARIAVGARILSALTSLPAFFVDIPAGLLVAVAVSIVLTVVCAVLILAPADRRVPVTD
jgi:hypothetical protein